MNNKTTNVALSLAVVVALVLGVLAYNKTPVSVLGAQGPQGVQGPAGRDGVDGRDGQDGQNGVTKVITQVVEKPITTLGAVSTLDGINFPYVSINGVREYYYNQNISATSSVPCSIKNPFNATSTLVSYTVLASANGMGSQLIDISTSTTAYASSSPSFVKGFTTGTVGFAIVWAGGATTTNNTLIGGNPSLTGRSDNVIAPSDFINFRIATTSAGTFGSYLTGTCKATIRAL